MKKRLFTVLMMCLLLSNGVSAQRGDVYQQSKDYEPPTDSLVLNKLSQWQDLKFGVLFHWGIYSVPGIMESWNLCVDDWIKRDTTKTYQQYKDWYWGLSKQFNPVKFNPDQWADVMKDAGMKYVLFTTKHHDGFCMFDSKYTDYSIANGPFKVNPKRDVAKYVFDSFRKKQFMIGAYFSKPDWHSQYYWWDVYPTGNRNVNYDIKKYPWRWQMFTKFVHNQVEELMTRYGSMDILWLDGGQVNKYNNQDIDMPGLASMARSHQPGLIVVDRTIHGPYENYQTPEQNIPDKQLSFPWESCITLGSSWGWSPNQKWKSPAKVINNIIEIVAKGGCLVLGVGPTPEGLIEPEAVNRLHKIGEWMRYNGKAIYNTRPTPNYHSGKTWFTADKNGRTLYSIYAVGDDDKLPSVIVWQGNVPKKGTKMLLLKTGKTAKWKVRGNDVTVTLPKGLANESVAFSYKIK